MLRASGASPWAPSCLPPAARGPSLPRSDLVWKARRSWGTIEAAGANCWGVSNGGDGVAQGTAGTDYAFSGAELKAARAKLRGAVEEQLASIAYVNKLYRQALRLRANIYIDSLLELAVDQNDLSLLDPETHARPGLMRLIEVPPCLRTEAPGDRRP
jgi:hypothetical protein